MPAKAEDILSGFRVNWMNLRDADTGKILWQVKAKHNFFFDSMKIIPSQSLIVFITGQWGPQYTRGGARGPGAQENTQVPCCVQRNQLLIHRANGKIPIRTEGIQDNSLFFFVVFQPSLSVGSFQRPLSGGMEFRLWFCDSQLDQHLAEFDWGRARESDDARQCAHRQRCDRDNVLWWRPSGQHF